MEQRRTNWVQVDVLNDRAWEVLFFRLIFATAGNSFGSVLGKLPSVDFGLNSVDGNFGASRLHALRRFTAGFLKQLFMLTGQFGPMTE